MRIDHHAGRKYPWTVVSVAGRELLSFRTFREALHFCLNPPLETQ